MSLVLARKNFIEQKLLTMTINNKHNKTDTMAKDLPTETNEIKATIGESKKSKGKVQTSK
jgi:hypothetical protein